MAQETVFRVGLASCGIASGSAPVFERLKSLLAGLPGARLQRVGCVGLCFHEPLVEVERDGARYLYGEVSPRSRKRSSPSTSGEGDVGDHLVASTVHDAPENGMLARQVRIVLRNCGLIDPERIEDYLDRGGTRPSERPWG